MNIEPENSINSDMHQKLNAGRPSIYTPELAAEICNVIASSTKGTKRLCRDYPHWPSQDTLFTWLKNHSEFSEQYAQAKRCQIEVLVDEMLDIADDSSLDSFITEDGSFVYNNITINRAKLKIDTRKWLACKLVPRVYGNMVSDTQPLNRHEDYLKHLK